MNLSALRIAGAAAVATILTIAPAQAQSKHHNLSVNFDGQVASCADLRVKTDGALAQAVDKFSLQGASIQIDGGSGGSIHVTASDRADYAVEACRFAVADDQATAQQAVAATSVTRNAWRVETHGPAYADSNTQWQVYLIVQTPRNGSVELNTVNGPISIRGVNGTVKAKAVNGPLSVHSCAGVVDAQTTNGPISFSGQGGDVKLTAINGPLTVEDRGRRLEWAAPGSKHHERPGAPGRAGFLPFEREARNQRRGPFHLQSGDVPQRADRRAQRTSHLADEWLGGYRARFHRKRPGVGNGAVDSLKSISHGSTRMHTDEQNQNLSLLFYLCASVSIRG